MAHVSRFLGALERKGRFDALRIHGRQSCDPVRAIGARMDGTPFPLGSEAITEMRGSTTGSNTEPSPSRQLMRPVKHCGSMC
jgi:hypothetical protein